MEVRVVAAVDEDDDRGARVEVVQPVEQRRRSERVLVGAAAVEQEEQRRAPPGRRGGHDLALGHRPPERPAAHVEVADRRTAGIGVQPEPTAQRDIRPREHPPTGEHREDDEEEREPAAHRVKTLRGAPSTPAARVE